MAEQFCFTDADFPAVSRYDSINQFVDRLGIDKKQSFLTPRENKDDEQYRNFLKECKESSKLGKDLGMTVQRYQEGTFNGLTSVCIDEPISELAVKVFIFDSSYAPTDPVRKAWLDHRQEHPFRKNPYYISVDEWDRRLQKVIAQIENMRAAGLVFGLPGVKIALWADSQGNSSISIYRPFLSVLRPITKDYNPDHYYSKVMRNVIEQAVWEELCPNDFGMSEYVQQTFARLVKYFNKKYGFFMDLPYNS